MNADSEQVLRIASANMEEGGLDPDGSATRWERTMDALADWSPDVVCVQEMASRRDPRRLRRHLWATANELGMVPVLGSEGGVSGNHPAVLVRLSRLAITDEGPLPRGPGHDPAWAEALLQVRPGGPVLRVMSVHLPPRSAVQQLTYAEQLAALAAQRGEHAVIGGDWNCYAPADGITAETLAGLPPHLRPARMHVRGETLTANYAVHDTLAAVGLADAASSLDPARRRPADLKPTGINGGGRVDRFYVTPALLESGAVRSYEQKDGGGSDHELTMLTLGLAEMEAAQAPGFQQ